MMWWHKYVLQHRVWRSWAGWMNTHYRCQCGKSWIA